MHEMSLVESIMNILADERKKHELGRITRVTLQNGALAGVVTEAMTFAWSALTPGTEFDGCEMVINETPLVLKCGSCGEEFTPENAKYTPCPGCEAILGHEVLAGKELLIENIEAE